MYCINYTLKLFTQKILFNVVPIVRQFRLYDTYWECYKSENLLLTKLFPIVSAILLYKKNSFNYYYFYWKVNCIFLITIKILLIADKSFTFFIVNTLQYYYSISVKYYISCDMSVGKKDLHWPQKNWFRLNKPLL